QALIGMDIIGQGDFAVSNFDRDTRVSFRMPSQSHAGFSPLERRFGKVVPGPNTVQAIPRKSKKKPGRK
ncbi:MAG TPA: hypothetical protein VII84_04350, partial [Acidimicrobiales bacterium]